MHLTEPPLCWCRSEGLFTAGTLSCALGYSSVWFSISPFSVPAIQIEQCDQGFTFSAAVTEGHQPSPAVSADNGVLAGAGEGCASPGAAGSSASPPLSYIPAHGAEKMPLLVISACWILLKSPFSVVLQVALC